MTYILAASAIALIAFCLRSHGEDFNNPHH